MQIRNRANALLDGRSANSTTERQTRRKRQAGWLCILALGMMFSVLALQASADTTIYFYSSDGSSVDVTSCYSFQQGYLYDSLLNPVATVDNAGRIYSLTNGQQQIGIIAYSPTADIHQ